MKSASVSELKKELKSRESGEILEICARLIKYKKENKELLTYILFESEDEQGYIQGNKDEMDVQFEEMNQNTLYYIKKSVRKILRSLNKYLRFSANLETETELRMYFCKKMQDLDVDIKQSNALNNLYLMQIKKIGIAISKMHEDLQYDYTKQMEKLK